MKTQQLHGVSSDNNQSSPVSVFRPCISGVMLSMSYYLSIWFQAIDCVDALQSRIRNLAFILALVVSGIIADVSVSKVG